MKVRTFYEQHVVVELEMYWGKCLQRWLEKKKKKDGGYVWGRIEEIYTG